MSDEKDFGTWANIAFMVLGGILTMMGRVFNAGRQAEKFALKKDLDAYVKKTDFDVIEKKLDKIEERQAEDRALNAENHRQIITLLAGRE